MENQTYEEAVLKAVMWWSEKSFKTPMNQNNGDDSREGAMTFALMNQLAMRVQAEVTDDQIKVFEKKLTEDLLEAHSKGRTIYFMGVDYHPDLILAKACEKAGINRACMPCKSAVRISMDNTVAVKFTYHGSYQII